MHKDITVSGKTVERLSLYRRLVLGLKEQGETHVFSHQLASMARGTPAQVRRDMMVIGYSGSPTRGYDVDELIKGIGDFLDAPAGQSIALVGIGNLGRAILAYFTGRRPRLAIVAAFDSDPNRVNQEIHGCPCYRVEDIATVIPREAVDVGILTVPGEAAQSVAEALYAAGVRGLLNFTPTRLRLPEEIHVVDYDITMCLEKVAYFARQGRKPPEGVPGGETCSM